MPSPSSRRTAILGVCVVAGLLRAGAASAQVNVTTHHNDVARTGANLAETVLRTSNVNPAQFGKLFERSVDDQIYAQPLYVSNVSVPGVGQRNVVYVATVNDSIYAFDADDPAAASPLWSVSYIDPVAGIVPVNHTEVGQVCGTYTDFTGNIGIVGTPVIDAVSQTMYFVARTKENGTFVQRLHAVDIRDGRERSSSPVVIQASVPGTGDGHDAQNNVVFNAQTQNQRSALLLSNGAVYVAWASHCDQGPYHGWILGYDAVSLQPVLVYNSTANGGSGGFWPPGLSADASGNIYAATGNGSFDGDVGGSSRGNSFVKLSPGGVLLDWFTPYNWAFLNSTDQDLGIQGALLVPNTNLLVGGGKQGVLYVLNRDNMGHFRSGSDSQIVQSFQASTAGRMNGSPVHWASPNNGPVIYLWPAGDPLKAFRLVGGLFQTTPIAQGSTLATGEMPGAMLSLSADGSTPGTGIIWAALATTGDPNHETRPGILRAYDANDLTTELWNSLQNAARDDLGNFSKFACPTIANGKVYLATFSNNLVVYGLLGGGSANKAPVVNAGADQTITPNGTASLTGTARDDGLPNPPGALTTTWAKLSGPGSVTFSNPGALSTTASFSAPGIYTLRLTASDGALASTDDVMVTVGSPSGSGTGLRAQYYNDPRTGSHFGTLVLTRTDASVDFDWGNGAPGAGIQSDDFSVRWTGQVGAVAAGDYTFSTISDDGVRLWVNGHLIIDNWTDHGATTDTSAAVPLAADTNYDIKMEFYEHGGQATARLLWAYPGQTQAVIPQSRLHPEAPTNQPPTVDAGPDQVITLPAEASLDGTASDDGLPNPPGALTATWRKISGREESSGGTVVFGNPNALRTTARFGADGIYVLRLTVSDGAITVSDDVAITVNPAPSATGTGLIGQYYNDPGPGVYFSTLVLTRPDPAVDFDWGYEGPGPGVQTDYFSVRWTGQVRAVATGEHTFSTISDDGVRLWVNGQLIIDNWTDHGATTDTSAAVPLTADTNYDITMEFYERGAQATAKLRWAYPGQPPTVIPQARLYPPPSGTGTGLTGQYYNDPGPGAYFGSLVLTRTDPTVDFDWGSGAPGPGVQGDHFSVRWTGQVQPVVTGDYTFSTISDDGVRLWVNGQLIIDNWTDHGKTTDTSAAIALVAGVSYDLRMEYYDSGGMATAKLLWAYPGQAQTIIPRARLHPPPRGTATGLTRAGAATAFVTGAGSDARPDPRKGGTG